MQLGPNYASANALKNQPRTNNKLIKLLKIIPIKNRSQ